MILLENKNIIHVVNVENVNKSIIKFIVKVLSKNNYINALNNSYTFLS
jgi:hypothetical protein